jgi:hypothetical protein
MLSKKVTGVKSRNDLMGGVAGVFQKKYFLLYIGNHCITMGVDLFNWRMFGCPRKPL